MFSIIMPMDTNRLEQFKNTKAAYDQMPQVKEFVMPTRCHDEVRQFLDEFNLGKDVRLLPYTVDEGFNPAKALNIGVRESKYENLIITGPEVKPTTQVLEQLSECLDKNIVCQTWDESEQGNLTSLVNHGYRDHTPQPYFLGMFLKKDVEAINGWDEEFMKGYAYDDDDFGARWVRAGLPFEVREDIQATHQYHPRSETISGGLIRNQEHYYSNNDNGVIRPMNGLIKLAE